MEEEKTMNYDVLYCIVFDDGEDERIDMFNIEDDLIEFIRYNKNVIGEYSIYEMKKIYLSQDKILH